MNPKTPVIVKQLKDKLLEIRNRDGRRLTEVIVHKSFVLPNWAFIVDKWDRLFLVLGEDDFTVMLDGKPQELAVFAIPSLFDVPVIVNNDNRTAQVMNGTYLWAMETYKAAKDEKTEKYANN